MCGKAWTKQKEQMNHIVSYAAEIYGNVHIIGGVRYTYGQTEHWNLLEVISTIHYVALYDTKLEYKLSLIWLHLIFFHSCTDSNFSNIY